MIHDEDLKSYLDYSEGHIGSVDVDILIDHLRLKDSGYDMKNGAKKNEKR